MVDVGGQRSQRKKWIKCFTNITAILFCVAMSEYDLTLEEDNCTNRMHESLKIFREVVNSDWFEESSIILFLNKKDLFAEKILRKDLNLCFPEYKGGKDYQNAANFIATKFKSQKQKRENQKHQEDGIYVQYTCATDTNNVRMVFNAVRDHLTKQTLDILY
jgi:hypothetical protein